MSTGKKDVEKERYWQKVIGEAARSGVSARAFCRQRRLRESQFYWWRHHLEAGRRETSKPKPGGKEGASFALVDSEAGTADAGIELVLSAGRRLRISRGVDEATLRAVLAALEPAGC